MEPIKARIHRERAHSIHLEEMPQSAASTASKVAFSLADVFEFKFDSNAGGSAKRFVFPDFQRPYVWTKADVQKLLDDVDELRADPDGAPGSWYPSDDSMGSGVHAPEYFFGSICLRKCETNDDCWEILDGQQRLTSFLLIAAVIDLQVSALEETAKQASKADAALLDVIREQWKAAKSILEKQILFSSNPRTHAQVRKVFEEFKLDYELLRIDGPDLYLAMLCRDVGRFEYILRKGMVAVRLLISQVAAEQFFQGENNRGLPLSLLDLLKAYHMRVAKACFHPEMGRIWHLFNDGEEEVPDEDDAAKTSSAEDKSPDRERRAKLVSSFVIPAMLMRFGIAPWESSRPAFRDRCLSLLKGKTGTHLRGRFIDWKLSSEGGAAGHERFAFGLLDDPGTGIGFFCVNELHLAIAEAITAGHKRFNFDLLDDPGAGIGFFRAIELYLAIAEAITAMTEPQDGGSRGYSSLIHLNAKEHQLLVLAGIAWADRFLKVGDDGFNAYLEEDKGFERLSAEKIGAALRDDPDLRAWLCSFARLLDIFSNRGGKKYGLYDRLNEDTMLKWLKYRNPEESFFFLPHRSGSPAACLRELKALTHPDRFQAFHYAENYERQQKYLIDASQSGNANEH